MAVDSKRGIGLEVVKAGETGAGTDRERRLGMGPKQLVTGLAEFRQRLRARKPIEVADAAAPVSQVEVVLRLSRGFHRYGVRKAAQTVRSAAWTAGSRSAGRGSMLDTPSPCAGEPSVEPAAAAPLPKPPRRRPRRRRDLRGAAAGTPPSTAGRARS